MPIFHIAIIKQYIKSTYAVILEKQKYTAICLVLTH